jgi:hypothetical protein
MMCVPRPSWEPLSLRCECGHEWQDWQPLNVPTETWVAHLRGLACPACATRRGTLRGKALEGTIIGKMLAAMREAAADD